MEKVLDILELDNFIKSTFKKNIASNCFFLKTQLEQYIDEEILLKEINLPNQYLLIHYINYYKLYYAIENINIPLCLDVKKPIAIEIVYSSKTYNNSIINYFKENGFVLIATRKRMSVSYENLASVSYDDNIKFAQKEDADLIKKMLNKNFDPYTSSIPSDLELVELINDKKIIAYYENNELLGFLHFDITKNITSIKQIVVSENARGKGISKILLSFWKSLFTEKTIFRLFVKNTNKNAINLYEKSGFTFDDCECIALIKQN